MKKALSRSQETERLDETPNAFARRMLTFKEKTLPVLKHYDDRGKLYIVSFCCGRSSSLCQEII